MGSQYILYLIIAGVIGLLVGLLLSSLFSGGGKNKDEKIPPKALLDAGFVEETRLLYNSKDKKVIIEFDGVFQSDLSKLTIDNKKQVFDILTGLQNWINPVNPVQAVAPLVETPPLEEKPGPFSGQQLVEPFSSTPSETDLFADLQGSIAEPEPDIVNEKIEVEPYEKKNLSIAEQISVILEDVIKDTEYKEKGIKLIENQENGVDVWVGLEKYSGIENVPYPEVQQLIRNAAKRWEQEVESQQKYQS